MDAGPLLPRSIRWRLQLGLLALPPPSENDGCSTEELYTYNSSLLHDQRTRYQDLVEKYEVHVVSTESDTQQEAAAPPEAEIPDETTALAALDPLTAIVREQEAQAKRRQELELKYRKERARRNRGLYEGEGESPTNGVDAVRSSVSLWNDFIQPHSLYSLSHCTDID